MGVRQTWFGGRRQEVVPSRVTCSTKGAENWNKPAFAEKGWVTARAVAEQGDEPWGAVTHDYDGPRRSAMLRKCFDLPAAVADARAYVTGLGFYELRLNGKKVGDAVFTPGWTRYSRRVQYQVYDVTDLLAKGPNAVGAILGNGWWSGGLGWEGAERHAKKGQNLRLLLQLEIRCTDGSEHTVVTGHGWQ